MSVLGWGGVTNGCDIQIVLSSLSIHFSFSVWNQLVRTYGQKHTCTWRHTGCLWADVGVQTRAISDGRMGPSQHCCLVAQSTMAPVQTSCPMPHNRKWCICVCLCVRVCASFGYLMPDISDATADQGITMSFLRIVRIHSLRERKVWVDRARCY